MATDGRGNKSGGQSPNKSGGQSPNKSGGQSPNKCGGLSPKPEWGESATKRMVLSSTKTLPPTKSGAPANWTKGNNVQVTVLFSAKHTALEINQRVRSKLISRI